MDDYSYGRRPNRGAEDDYGYERRTSKAEGEDDYDYDRKPTRRAEDDHGYERRQTKAAEDEYGYERKQHKLAEDEYGYDGRPSKVEEDDYTYEGRPTRPTASTHHRPTKVAEDDYAYEKEERPTRPASGTHHQQQPHHQPASSSDLLSSAKYMAEAAQHALHHETGKIDKSRMAGAAEDILEAASRYGKLEERGFGQYIEKAESYLHQYGGGHSSAPHSAGSGHHVEGGAEAHSSRPSHSYGRDEEEQPEGAGGSGYGQYLKMAEGFLKKH